MNWLVYSDVRILVVIAKCLLYYLISPPYISLPNTDVLPPAFRQHLYKVPRA